MDAKRVALGTAAYTVVTFPIAVLWHVGLFKNLYHSFGYFSEEPSFAVGLLTILVQGFILSGLYPLVQLSGRPIARGLKYSAIVGVFFWTSHVLALVAKQALNDAPLFIAMETGYLAIQFGVFGALIGLIYRDLGNSA